MEVQQKTMVLREWMLCRWLELERRMYKDGRGNETSLWCCDVEETAAAVHGAFIISSYFRWRSGGSDGHSVVRGDAAADGSE